MAKFEKFVPLLHEKEGKFVNDPDDAGGATNMGVTLNTYTAYCRKKGYPKPTVERLKNMTEEVWQDIIRTMYWNVCRADDIQSQSIANMMVDWAVHSGPATSIKHVQRILKVKADGVVGPITLAAINSASPLPLFGNIREARLKYLGSLVANMKAYDKDGNEIETQAYKNRKFINGWINRVNSITFDDYNF